MDNTNPTKTSEWVHDRLARLAPSPAWRPDPHVGLVHLRWYERMAKRRHRFQRAVVLALLIASVVVLAVPTTRAIAQRLLDHFYMRSPEVVRSMMPRSGRPLLKTKVPTPPEMGRFVSSLAEAQQEAGFEPRLPPTLIQQLASGLAVLTVGGPFDAQMIVKVEDLRAAIRRRGMVGVDVPQNWDGVEIDFHAERGVLAAFLDGTLTQAPPPELLTPPGFPLRDFAETVFRIVGLSPSEAHNSRDKLAESGGLFAVVPSDANYNFREVSLKSGRGLLFENDTDQDDRQKCAFCPGPHERVLTWAASDRVFQLRSQTMAVDQAVEMANSIN